MSTDHFTLNNSPQTEEGREGGRERMTDGNRDGERTSSERVHMDENEKERDEKGRERV